MSLFDFISPGLTAASQAVAANNQGQQEGSALLREIGQQKLSDEYKRAQIAEANTRTKVLQSPVAKPKRTPQKLSVNGKPMLGTVDEEGNFFDAFGKPIVGDVAPYDDPKAPPAPLATTKGYFNRDGSPILGKDGKPLMPTATTPTNVYFPGIGPDGTPHTMVGAGKGDPNVQDTGVGRPVAGQGSPRESRMLAKQFQTENKGIYDWTQKYARAKTVLDEAGSARNPAAYKAALLNFASIADANPQMRQGIIQMISQIDPSIGGRWDIAMQKLSSGTLPQSQIANMARVIDRLNDTQRSMFVQRRSAAVKRHPDLENYIEGDDELFTLPAGVNHAAPVNGSSGNVDLRTPAKGGTKNPFLP